MLYRAGMTRSLVPLHSPQGTVTHFVVQEFFARWLEYRRLTGRRVPGYVEREFWKYLECGDRRAGFTTWSCPDGHVVRHVAASCRGRAWCAWCLTRRQRERGQHLIESVIGNVPVRHWVECLPPQLRYVLGYDERLLSGGFRALSLAVFEYQRRRAADLLGLPLSQIHPGGLVVNHRVSANLDANYHFHGIFPDGVFIQREPGGELEFFRLPAPTEAEIAAVAFQACVQLCAVLARRGFWKETASSRDTLEGILTLPNRPPSAAKFFGQAARYAEGGVAPRDGAHPFHIHVGAAIQAG
jgi:hypothetical protein